MIIYKVTNKENGKIYVGQTVRSLDERMNEHLRHNHTAFDLALKKYGIDCFEIEKIDEAETIEELNTKEAYWIRYYNCIVPNGYNMCEGGGNTKGYHHRDESKMKMSETKKTLYLNSGNPFFGKNHSVESRIKMSNARKGMKHLTEDQVKKIRDSHHTVKVRNVETQELFESVKEAAAKYDIKETHITRVCKGKRKSTGGFHWEYVKEP